MLHYHEIPKIELTSISELFFWHLQLGKETSTSESCKKRLCGLGGDRASIWDDLLVENPKFLDVIFFFSFGDLNNWCYPFGDPIYCSFS